MSAGEKRTAHAQFSLTLYQTTKLILDLKAFAEDNLKVA